MTWTKQELLKTLKTTAKGFDLGQIEKLIGNKKEFAIKDVGLIFKKLQSHDDFIAEAEWQESEPKPTALKIKDGAIEFDNLVNHLQAVAASSGKYFDPEKLKDMFLKRPQWKALVVSQEPLRLNPIIAYKVQEILNTL